MPLDPLKIAIKGSTQEHLSIEDIIDDIVILKDGSCSVVMQVSSVNFDLLSEREQSALVFAYGGILNSLNFPIQIVIHTNTKDISSYMNRLKESEEKQTNLQLKERIRLYKKFVEETVKKNDVLSKTFYVIVSFLTVASMVPRGRNKNKELPFSKEYILEKAKAALEPKRDHLIRLFSRLGLEIKQLETRELIELFYRIYNEETAMNQKVQNLNYDAPVVTTKR